MATQHFSFLIKDYLFTLLRGNRCLSIMKTSISEAAVALQYARSHQIWAPFLAPPYCCGNPRRHLLQYTRVESRRDKARSVNPLTAILYSSVPVLLNSSMHIHAFPSGSLPLLLEPPRAPHYLFTDTLIWGKKYSHFIWNWNTPSLKRSIYCSNTISTSSYSNWQKA